MTQERPELLGREKRLTLTELCECLQTETGFVIDCIEFGIVEVAGASEDSWAFSFSDQARIRRAWNLHRDLEINHSGLGMVLDLLDDMEGMRQRMRLLEQRLQDWEGHRSNS